MNLYCQIVIFFFIAFSLCNLYGGDLLIEKDGNYVYSDRISVEKNKAYRISGVFSLENAPENSQSCLQVGLVPYGADGKSLCDAEDFPLSFEREDAGFILLDAFVFEENSSCEFNRTIKLSGAALREFSLVVGAYLAEGAKFRISQIKIEPLGDFAFEVSPQGGVQEISSSNGDFSSDKGRSESVEPSLANHSSQSSNENKAEKSFQSLPGGHRIIYVNSDIGSDKFEGLKRKRGQADGPKKTINSALKNALGGDAIVLQESNAGYKAGLLKAKSNKTLVIRAEGSVVIKSN